MAEDTRLRDRLTADRLLLAAVLLVGIAGTGIVRRQLGLMGYNQLGRIVFVLGYGGTVFVVWYGWIRPLDITGPTADREITHGDPESDSGTDSRTDESNPAGTDDTAAGTTESRPTGDTNASDAGTADDARTR